jgi:multidrug efflux pump subunit AcrB
MSLADRMQRHRRSILFFLSVLVVAGVVSAFFLPVSLFPRVDFPRVRISLDAGDRPADRMAIEVTRLAEEAARSVPSVREVRSTTSRGSAEIDVNFGWGQDMVAAMLQVNAALAQISQDLPSGTRYNVIRMDPTVFPVLAYSLTSRTLSLAQLRDFALYQLQPLFSAVKGVAKVEVQGGLTQEYRVTVSPAKLEAAGLTFDDLAQALSASNVIRAVGRLEDHEKLYLVLCDTQFNSLSALRRTVLRSGPHGTLFLGDIASIEDGTAPNWTRVTADGRDAVLVSVYQQLDANTVQISADTSAQLAAYAPHVPEGVNIANWYDQSRLIVSSADSVRDALLAGAFMAALILLLFLRNFKVTLITVIAVPSVLAITVLVLSACRMSFNIMTLGGMAAAVGLIIDDAIVMVEQIIRRVRGQERHDPGRVMLAAEEFAIPLAGSSAATMIIFAPLAFLSGVTGAFFKALSLTMVVSLGVSFLVAYLAVPLLCNRILTEKDAAEEEGGAFTERVHKGYEYIMHRLLAKPAWILAGIIPLLAIGLTSYFFLGSGFMPSMDEGGFILDYRTESGTSLKETDRLLRQVEGILRATPEVETYSRRTGLQLGGMMTEANEGDFFVRLKDHRKRPIEDVIEDVRGRIESNVPGLEIEMLQLMEDLIGDLTAVPQPIEIKLFSDNEKELLSLAPLVAKEIETVPGVVDVKDGIIYAGDALNIVVDRTKASLEGVDPESVARMAEGYLDGTVTTQIQRGPKMIEVRLWIPETQRLNTRRVGGLLLRSSDGHIFPLERVAEVIPVTGQPQITRDDLKRMVPVTGRIAGRDMGSVIRDVKRVLARKGLIPSDVYFTMGGLYKQQQMAIRGMLAVFGAAAALLFFLLLFLFERFRPALAVLLTALLSLGAVFIGLTITGTELNISSMMGMTMILGIVTEVAIFMVFEFFSAPPELDRTEALIYAGTHRMRAITMSTIAAILALFPLALGIGQGSAMERPLAIAIISGMTFQLPLVFFVLPVLFTVLGVNRPTAPESGG